MVFILAITIQTLEIFAWHPFYNEKWWRNLGNVCDISADRDLTNSPGCCCWQRNIRIRSLCLSVTGGVTTSFTGKHWDVRNINSWPSSAWQWLVCWPGCVVVLVAVSLLTVLVQVPLSTDSGYTAPRTTAVIASPPSPPPTLSWRQTTGAEDTLPPS